ncbi:MAG: homoserine dehydrogenase [Agathobacter sp.]|nr:homoserine dehydrogenase [Agathobacter sp.]
MKIAVMGYGTIGSGVVEVLNINQEKIAKRAGEPVEVKYVLDLRDFPGSPIEDRLIKDYMTIVNDPEVGVVVETMGGVEPAYTFVKAMLEAGKQVATSNKNLVATKGAELIRIAREHNVNFLFEASVGGGIPIIRPLNKCLTADEIEQITGILNGTTNYMLTKMSEEGTEFSEALRDAQEKGYAEKDPTADVEGFDPCRKIAILTSMVCGKQVDFEDIHCEGITKITPIDIKYAKAMGCSIKLLATSKKVGESYSCIVAPFMLPKDHALCGVGDVFNGIFVHGNVLGDAMFYGSGAGKLPTASAVVADVVDMVKHQHTNIYIDWSEEKMELLDYRDSQTKFFVRTSSYPAAVLDAFGHVNYVDADVEGETAFTTELMTEGEFESRVSKIELINRIRLA